MKSLAQRRQEAEDIVDNFVMGSTGAAAVTGPLPGTSVVLTGLEVTMMYKVARVFDFHPTIQEAGVTLSSLVAASGVLKHFAMEAATAFPVIGWWLIKPAIAGTVAKAVGKIAIEHYVAKYIEEHGA